MAQPPNPFEQQRAIPGVKRIVVVGAGKGGVGKSTVTINIALAMSKLGLKVGVLDADIYGPSLPRLVGALNQKPTITPEQIIEPIVRYGLKTMSIGFLIPEARGLVWRGPLLFKTMDQFFRQVNWGELDYLFIDLPPGTGDVPLSVAQKVPVSGAIAVCTPQNIALMDVERAINMFETIAIPMLGLIENMSYFIPPGSTEKIALFPKGDLDAYLTKHQLPKLGIVPFQTQISMSGEIGIPIVESHPDGAEAKAFRDVAILIRGRLE
jgi:ATP-binding protein involved in chromosome partitioning